MRRADSQEGRQRRKRLRLSAAFGKIDQKFLRIEMVAVAQMGKLARGAKSDVFAGRPAWA
jgi:hypothetical protein